MLNLCRAITHLPIHLVRGWLAGAISAFCGSKSLQQCINDAVKVVARKIGQKVRCQALERTRGGG